MSSVFVLVLEPAQAAFAGLSLKAISTCKEGNVTALDIKEQSKVERMQVLIWSWIMRLKKLNASHTLAGEAKFAVSLSGLLLISAG